MNINNNEEKVRENFISFLHNDYSYPLSSIKKEVSIQMGSSTKRADIVVYSDNGDILGIVETKSKGIKEGKKQLESYMSAIRCEWGVWTNGSEEEHCYKDNSSGKIIFEPTFIIPSYKESLDFAKKIIIKNFSQLKEPINLKYIFIKIKQKIYANTNIGRSHKQGAELTKLLFCKIYDELQARDSDNYSIRFQVTFQEDKNSVGERIKKIWEDFISDLSFGSDIFEKNEKILLDDFSLNYIVKQLQSFSLLKANKDVIGEAFEIFAEKGFVGERGQFFTPRKLVDLAVKIVNPKKIIQS